MTVTVTDQDIREGYRCDSLLCPVSLAIQRNLPEGSVTWVGLGRVVMAWEPNGKRTDYRLPEDIQNAVSAFDRTGVMAPVTFEMEEAA